jgi:hypothetical protein
MLVIPAQAISLKSFAEEVGISPSEYRRLT